MIKRKKSGQIFASSLYSTQVKVKKRNSVFLESRAPAGRVSTQIHSSLRPETRDSSSTGTLTRVVGAAGCAGAYGREGGSLQPAWSHPSWTVLRMLCNAKSRTPEQTSCCSTVLC